jgi:hypothetical protein
MQPHEFDLRAAAKDETMIEHLGTSSTFWIGDHYVNPVHGGFIKMRQQVGERTWLRLDRPNYQMPFVDWLREVKAEAEAPDLWADLERDRAILQGAAEPKPANEPFTADERPQIIAALDQLTEQVRETYELTAGQMAEVDAKVEDLRSKVSRMSRTEWFTYTVGTLDLLQMTVLPDGAARRLTLGLLKAVGHLFGVSLPELPTG